MDLDAVTSVARPLSRRDFGSAIDGDAWLAGGTWLFSEPQPDVRRLVDLQGLGWEPVGADDAGLSIAATCPIAVLDGFETPAAWTAAPLIGQCCRSFLASHKIWNVATVGGNVCLGLPAGPMISLAVALAVLSTGRPVKLELTREEQFSATTSRHPMRVRVKLGARRDGVLTAIEMEMLSNAGAYGNHSVGVLFHGSGECIALYRCPNKKIDGHAVYTNTLPSGAFRGYGLSQTNFAVESALDEMARQLGIDPFAFRRINVVISGDPLVSSHEGTDDVEYGSYGLEQCLDHVEASLAFGSCENSGDWEVGRGVAAAMIDTIPPRGHRAESRLTLATDGLYDLSVGTAEFGNGTTTVHAQIAASILGTTTDRIRIKQSDTEHVGHDTGAYGSTGTVVAGSATREAAEALRDTILDFAAGMSDVGSGDRHLGVDHAQIGAGSLPLADLASVAERQGRKLSVRGQASGSPRSIAFNVQGFEVAVHRRTGEVRILRSVHSADAGTVINPMQCRGQVEGGVAQAIGAALYEEMIVDTEGHIANPSFRGYHIPAFADVPRTEVHFADTYDRIGPLGAKSMSESPYNPVAAALANAIHDATGIRLRETPFKADRIHRHLLAR